MILLPNGCSCSTPTLYPKVRKSKAALNKDWYVQYYFTDPAKLNAHTNINMVAKVYDIRRNSRQHERLKGVNNNL